MQFRTVVAAVVLAVVGVPLLAALSFDVALWKAALVVVVLGAVVFAGAYEAMSPSGGSGVVGSVLSFILAPFAKALTWLRSRRP
jgi:hypothetical protein